MRNLIFNNPDKRILLESIMHPIIQEEVKQKLSTASGPYQLVVIPLLTTSFTSPTIAKSTFIILLIDEGSISI